MEGDSAESLTADDQFVISAVIGSVDGDDRGQDPASEKTFVQYGDFGPESVDGCVCAQIGDHAQNIRIRSRDPMTEAFLEEGT